MEPVIIDLLGVFPKFIYINDVIPTLDDDPLDNYIKLMILKKLIGEDKDP